MIDTGCIDVFGGLDVGKGEPTSPAVTSAEKKGIDKRLASAELICFATEPSTNANPPSPDEEVEPILQSSGRNR